MPRWWRVLGVIGALIVVEAVLLTITLAIILRDFGSPEAEWNIWSIWALGIAFLLIPFFLGRALLPLTPTAPLVFEWVAVILPLLILHVVLFSNSGNVIFTQILSLMVVAIIGILGSLSRRIHPDDNSLTATAPSMQGESNAK